MHAAVLVCVVLALALEGVSLPIAVNMNGLSGEQLPFNDLMAHSRLFGSAEKAYDGSALPAANGYPVNSSFGIFIDAFYKPLEVFQFKAKCGALSGAIPTISGDLGLTVLWQQYDHTNGLLSANLTVNSTDPQRYGISFGVYNVSAQGTGSSCSDMHVLKPGCTWDELDGFDSQLLAYLKPFAGLPGSHLRFMDWGLTNGNCQTEWSGRTPVDWPSYRLGPPHPVLSPDGANCGGPGQPRCFDAVQTSGALKGKCLQVGVPWEKIIGFANAAGVDPWINVPAMASDDYIKQLADLVHKQLSPDLNVYVEYSNEVWNFGFEQWFYQFWTANQSVILHGDPDGLDYNPGESNPSNWGWRRTAARIKHVSDIFATEFGASERPRGRVRPVLSAQHAFSDPARQGLRYLQYHHGNVSDYLWGLATAPYMGYSWQTPDKQAPRNESMNCWNNQTADFVLDRLGYTQQIADTPSNVKPDEQAGLWEHKTLAGAFGLNYLAYEGGPDTSCFFNHDSSTEAKVAANKDPSIRGLTHKYLVGLAEAGLYPMTWFTCCAGQWDNQFGQWALCDQYGMTGQNCTEYPKFQGLMDAVKEPLPKFTAGVSVPTTQSPFNFTNRVGGGWSHGQAWSSFKGNESCYILLRLDEESPLNLKVELTATNHKDFTMYISVNGGAEAAVVLPANSTRPAPAVQLSFVPGANGLTLRPSGDPTLSANVTIVDLQVSK